MRLAFPPLLMEPSPQVSSAMRISRSGVAPGRPGAWATPPPAPSRRRLTLHGGFAVLDRQQRHLHDRAQALGFADLHSYLAARCQQASLAQLAGELGTTTLVVRHLLDHAALQPPPGPAAAARQRRHSTDQQLTQRAAALGFANLKEYLVERVATRAWPLSRVARELGVHPATVADRLDQHGLRRQRPTAGHQRAAQRRAATWAAKRRARLAELGFRELAGYLHDRVAQGWSERRIRAELRVGRAWLVQRLAQLGL